MKFNRHHDIKEATFDLTAMIDVVLLLIIFFMMSSQFAKVQLKPMALPQEAGEDEIGASGHEHTMIIEMDAAGGLSMMDVGSISRADLSAELERQKQAAGGSLATLEVLVRADRTCDARHLNTLAGLLARAGIRTWKLATEGGGGGGGGGA
ncbi:MAG: ExbD/TolR family protein [Phycisphaerales bacterium]